MESTKEVLVTRTVNLLKFDGSGTATANGITVTRNAAENSITITGGKPTSQTSSFLTKVLTLPAGSYVLYCPELKTQVESVYGLYVGKESVTKIATIWSSTKYRATFTLTEETKLWVWASFNTAGSYDNKVIHAMIFEGNDVTDLPDFEPYYHEYESTKEVMVRRSNNLLYFPSNLNSDLYKVLPYRNNGITYTKTIDDVHFEGEWDGTENTSGAWGVAYCNIPLAAGTYTLSRDENYQGQIILNKRVDNTWVNIAQCGYGTQTKTFTLTEPTVAERLFWSNATMDKNVPIDMWMHPMLVEGDTKQDYEPYYYEAEASKLITWAVDDTLVSVMDFSNMLYNKFIDNNGNITTNGVWATTSNFSPCTGNTVYWYNANMINYYPIARYCRFVFYDENKQFIGTAGVASGKEDKSVTSPANARYMKASISRFGNNDLSQPFPIKPIVYIK